MPRFSSKFGEILKNSPKINRTLQRGEIINGRRRSTRLVKSIENAAVATVVWPEKNRQVATFDPIFSVTAHAQWTKILHGPAEVTVTQTRKLQVDRRITSGRKFTF